MLTALLFSLASNQRTFLQKAGRVGERGGLGGEEEKEETGFLFSFSWLSHLFPIWYDFWAFDVYSIGIAGIASHLRTVLRNLAFLNKSDNAAKQHLICYQTRKLLFLPKDTWAILGTGVRILEMKLKGWEEI